jgi:hypothetical protein
VNDHLIYSSLETKNIADFFLRQDFKVTFKQSGSPKNLEDFGELLQNAE